MRQGHWAFVLGSAHRLCQRAGSPDRPPCLSRPPTMASCSQHEGGSRALSTSPRLTPPFSGPGGRGHEGGGFLVTPRSAPWPSILPGRSLSAGSCPSARGWLAWLPLSSEQRQRWPQRLWGFPQAPGPWPQPPRVTCRSMAFPPGRKRLPAPRAPCPARRGGGGAGGGGRAVPQPGAEAAVRSQGVASGQPASEELRGPQERGLLQTWTARDSALWASRNAAPVGRSTCYVSFGTSSLSGPLGPVSRRVGGTASEPEGRAVCPPGSGRAARPGASWPCPCSVGSSATRLRGPCGQLKARRGRVVTSPHV